MTELWEQSPAEFVGVKIALLMGERILILLRDDSPGIPHPGLWDLPGGGREGRETAFECAAREVAEELGIRLRRDAIRWNEVVPSRQVQGAQAVFMVADVSRADVDAIVFGSEGQAWQLVPVEEFLVRSDVIDYQRLKVRRFLAAQGRFGSSSAQSD